MTTQKLSDAIGIWVGNLARVHKEPMRSVPTHLLQEWGRKACELETQVAQRDTFLHALDKAPSTSHLVAVDQDARNAAYKALGTAQNNTRRIEALEAVLQKVKAVFVEPGEGINLHELQDAVTAEIDALADSDD